MSLPWQTRCDRTRTPVLVATRYDVRKRGRVWLAESGLQPNRLVGFDIAAEEFVSRTEVPSGGGVIRHMYFYPSGNEIWFGTDTNTIGRIQVG